MSKGWIMSTIKLGILKETKTPPDVRVAITPKECRSITSKYPDIKILVQRSDIRCFRDDEYKGIPKVELVDNVEDCDVLIGVKEVKLENLLPDKMYFFFSHTTKKQPYNKKLLQSVLEKNITLVDYEHLTDHHNSRIIAFGRWAGIVGCYNAFKAFGERFELFKLESAHILKDREKVHEELDRISLPPMKILVTGDGRASNGALEILDYMKINKVSKEDFIKNEYDVPVYCQLSPGSYVERIDGAKFSLCHFINNPGEYKSIFAPYTEVADMLITCHYWDPGSPVLFTQDQMKNDFFNISVIADVTCDISGSVPSTIRPSTINQPFYGYEPFLEREVDPNEMNAVTVMAVDNLPGELAKDASSDFSAIFYESILPSLVEGDSNYIIRNATIAKNGSLTKKYSYLDGYVSHDCD